MKLWTWKRIVLSLALIVVIGYLIPIYGYKELVMLLGIENALGIEFKVFTIGRIMLVLPVGPHAMVFVTSIVVSIASAVHIFARAKLRYFELIRMELMQLISSVSAMVRSRVPIIEALEEASRIIGEPLRSAIMEFISLIRLGEDPHRALRKVFGKAPSEVRLLASSIVIAMMSGGRVPEVLTEANRYVQQLQRMEFIRKHRLAEQRFVALMAVLAFAISGAIIVLLIKYVAPKFATLPGASTINVPFVVSSYFVSALFMDIIASLVVSRIMTGTFYLAPKYIALTAPLIALTFIIATLGIIHF